MEISRRQQEEQVAQIEKQFYELLLGCGEKFNNRAFLECEIQGILESMLHATRVFNFDDDLLLRLFDKLEYTSEYIAKVKAVWLPYRLSA